MTPPSGTETDPSHRIAGLAAVHSEQLFLAIFEQVAVGMALIETATGRFLRVNQRDCDIVGLSQDEMMATTFMAITHPDDLQADLDRMEELKAGRIRDFSMEKRLLRSDGSIVWVDLTVAPLWGVGEQPTSHIAVVQDITSRKKAEQKLAELNTSLEQQVAQRTHELEVSRQQLQAIVDGTSDAVFIKDLEGRYKLFNRAAERFAGKRRDEVIGHDDRFIFSPADAQALMEADRKVLANGVTTTKEEVATTVDGVQRTFLSTKGPLFDSQGGVSGLFGISRDITERKQAEEQLRESEERFRNIFEHAGTGIAITNLKGRFVRCNPAYCKLFGYTEVELRELNFKQVVHPEDLTANLVEADRLLAQEVPFFEIENRSRHKDGHDVWVHKFVSLLRDESGQPTTMFTLVTDITERRRAQELLEQWVAERTEALKASEAFNREILDSLSAHVVVLDAVGVIIAVNQVWEKAARQNDPLGMAQVSLGANYLKVCERAADTSSEARRILKGIGDVLAGQTPVFESEYLCVWPDHKQWFSMRVTPLRERGGCVIVHENVTDHKRAEQALRESEERLRLALDGADMGSWDVDLSTGEAIWNQRHATLYGYEAHDQPYTMHKWKDRVHPDDLERTLAAAKQAKQERTPFIVEHRVCLPQTNELRWLSLYGRFRYDEIGAPVRFSGISLDITERRRAETERQKFVSLVENSREFIGICDVNLWPVYVNAAGIQLVGLDGLDHACRVTVLDYFFEADRPFITEEFFPRVQREGHGEVEIRFRHFQTGQPIWMLYNVFPLRDGESVIGWATVSRDITDRKAAYLALQQAHQRLQVLSREVGLAEERVRGALSRELHDEFGQLLSALKYDTKALGSSLARRRALTGATRERVEAITQTVDRLFDSLHTMVRGLRPAVLEKLGLVPALESLLEDTETRFNLTCCLVAKRIAEPTSFGIELDATVYRMAQELVTNVIRHAKASSVMIGLEVNDGMVQLAVEDNGVGFAVVATDRHGLRGIRERAELLGGTVTIRSELDKGTVVTVGIPLRGREPKEGSAGLSQSSITGPSPLKVSS